MSVSHTLFTAILSMDAYNRGYNSGVQRSGTSDSAGLGEIGKIGDASILTRVDAGISSAQYQAWVAAGFYAIAYNWNGQTIISYRGTDNLASWANLDPWSDAPGSDVWNAYLQGIGDPLTAQAVLAAEFYQAVTGTQVGDTTEPDVILTGHSMGDGFAGFIPSLCGQEADLFDNRAFENSARSALVQKREERLVQKFIPQSAIEAFDEAVLDRLARRNVVPFQPGPIRPLEDRVAGERTAVVADDHLRLATAFADPVQLTGSLRAVKRCIGNEAQAFSDAFINDRQYSEPAAIDESSFCD